MRGGEGRGGEGRGGRFSKQKIRHFLILQFILHFWGIECSRETSPFCVGRGEGLGDSNKIESDLMHAPLA